MKTNIFGSIALEVETVGRCGALPLNPRTTNQQPMEDQVDYYDLGHELAYAPLPEGQTRTHKICGVTVVQRHDWSKTRRKEIQAMLMGNPSPNYSRFKCATPLPLGDKNDQRKQPRRT